MDSMVTFVPLAKENGRVASRRLAPLVMRLRTMFSWTALTWTKLRTRTSARPKKSTAAGLRMTPTEAGSRALPCPVHWSEIEVDEGNEVSSGRNTLWRQLPIG